MSRRPESTLPLRSSSGCDVGWTFSAVDLQCATGKPATNFPQKPKVISLLPTNVNVPSPIATPALSEVGFGFQNHHTPTEFPFGWSDRIISLLCCRASLPRGCPPFFSDESPNRPGRFDQKFTRASLVLASCQHECTITSPTAALGVEVRATVGMPLPFPPSLPVPSSTLVGLLSSL